MVTTESTDVSTAASDVHVPREEEVMIRLTNHGARSPHELVRRPRAQEASTGSRRWRLPAWSVLLAICLSLLSSAGVSAQTFQAPQQSDVEYYHVDAVGSVRLVTDAAGAVVSRHDYTPFGTPLASSDPLSAEQPRGFAGKERDSETGLDYFGGRYLLTDSSRFTTPDAPGNDQQPTDPQSWSLYAYTRNNPLKFTDRDGRAIDTIIDAASIVYDLYKIATEGATRTNLTALAADAASLVVPFATGGGALVRAGVAAERGLEATVAVSRAAEQLKINAAAGKAWEVVVKSQLENRLVAVAEQITVVTKSGLRTRLDFIGLDAAGNVVIVEAKASATAAVNANQRAAFAEIAKSGATVVGAGKGMFKKGFKIEPNAVEIARPPSGPGVID